MRRMLLVISLIVLSLFVIGCASTPLDTTSVSPISPLVSPLTSPVSKPVPTIEVPVPEAGMGNVHGTLAMVNSLLLLEQSELYLGTILTSEDGTFSSYYFDRAENPKATWVNAATGEFLFENVKPGRYVLILWWDVTSYVPIYRMGTTEPVYVEVKADGNTEIGSIESNQ